MNPDWDRLEACRESLREHMRIIRSLEQERDELTALLSEAIRPAPLPRDVLERINEAIDRHKETK